MSSEHKGGGSGRERRWEYWGGSVHDEKQRTKNGALGNTTGRRIQGRESVITSDAEEARWQVGLKPVEDRAMDTESWLYRRDALVEWCLLRRREPWRSIVMSMSVCVSVCLSVGEDISGTTGAIFTSFCACCLWLWLGLLRQGDKMTIQRRRGNFGVSPVTMHCTV